MEFIKEIFLFEYRVFAWAATAIISIAAIIGSVKTLIESYLSYKQLKLESSDKIESFLNRRNFIKAAVLTSVFSILVISSKRLTKYYKSRKKNFTVIHNKNLIANKKTGIIHLINGSSGRLPSKKHSTHRVDLNWFKPYVGFERRIYELLGLEALNQRNDEIAIELYLKAIDFGPQSFHLYDKLVRIYGRNKDYQKIYTLFKTALLNIDKLRISKKAYRRAKKEFTSRLNRTVLRSQIS